MDDRTYLPFEDFLKELHGSGFLTGTEILTKIDDRRRRRIEVTPCPISGVLSWQGELKSLGHLMRDYGYPPVKSTHGKRGYRL